MGIQPYTIKQGDTFGQIVLNNEELMKQLRKENPDATIWGDNGIIAKAAAMAGFTDKNGDGSIIDDAGSIYAGDTIDFSKAAKEKLAQQKITQQYRNAVNTENSTEAPIDAKANNPHEYNDDISIADSYQSPTANNEEDKEKDPISSLINEVTTNLLTETESPAKDPISSLINDITTDLLTKPEETQVPAEEQTETVPLSNPAPAETEVPAEEQPEYVPLSNPAPAETEVPAEEQPEETTTTQDKSEISGPKNRADFSNWAKANREKATGSVIGNFIRSLFNEGSEISDTALVKDAKFYEENWETA